MLLPKFDAPGFLTDFNEQQQNDWSQKISRAFDAARLRGADDGIAGSFTIRLKFKQTRTHNQRYFWTAFRVSSSLIRRAIAKMETCGRRPERAGRILRMERRAK